MCLGGSPQIIDIKPVVPHDVPRNMRVPEWVEDDPCLRRVVFTEEACEGLSKCVGEEARKSKSKFYEDVESFKAAASEVRLFSYAIVYDRMYIPARV